jgi:hypothetical protein
MAPSPSPSRRGLTVEQYADLNQVVTAGLLTKAHFCEKCAALAQVWEVKFHSDGVCKED